MYVMIFKENYDVSQLSGILTLLIVLIPKQFLLEYLRKENDVFEEDTVVLQQIHDLRIFYILSIFFCAMVLCFGSRSAD